MVSDLERSEDLHGTESQARTDGLKWWLFLVAVTGLAIAIDQLTKAYVVAHLALHDSWMPLGFVEPLFRFTHVRNTGAAFGIFPENGTIFLIIATVVSVVIIYYYRQLPPGALWIRLALGLQLSGALGNVIDRVRMGYVVDFFHVEFFPAVFNVADSCIVIGALLLAFEMLREERRLAKQEQHHEPDNTPESAPAVPDEHVMND